MHVAIRSADPTTKLGSHGFVNVKHYHSCGIFLWIWFSFFFQNTKLHILSESGENLCTVGFVGSPDDDV